MMLMLWAMAFGILCLRCGAETVRRHCKIVCPNCGATRDCSDP